MSTVNGGMDIITNGLVLYLDAANTKSYVSGSTTWNDISRFQNNGTLTNGPTFDSSNGGSMVFDGADDYILFNTPVVNSTYTGLTVDCWVYPGAARTQIILENGTDYITNSFLLAQENSTVFSFLVNRGGGAPSFYNLVYSSTKYVINRWYNVVATWKSNERVNIYLNGQLNNGTTAGVAQPTVRDGTTNLYMGIRPTNAVPFNGRISNSKIYNKALTAQEILQNYNATKTRFGL